MRRIIGFPGGGTEDNENKTSGSCCSCGLRKETGQRDCLDRRGFSRRSEVGSAAMNIELIKITAEYREQLFDMLTEWKDDIIKNHTDRSPWKIWKHDFHDLEYYIENLDTKEENESGEVPNSVFFCLDKDRNRLVGAVNIRHRLNDTLLKTGGHIGDGIRPSERRKGYGTSMIALALEECRKLGIGRVLMTCNKDNIGSARSIVNNGGVLENEVEEDGQTVQRYWIQL